ncbi:sensor histidine kinase [Croceicoccus naphthovorans]|uniref:sensor histidine kinase n=1 Tax=Croceicoccus naphthovorans TaxID=1348774 RepID=UPI0014707F08
MYGYRRAEAHRLQNEILSQELSHRIKNIFAIVSGLISLTARANEAFGEASRDLLGRISRWGARTNSSGPTAKSPSPRARK